MKKNLLIDVAILDVTNTSNTDVFNLAKKTPEYPAPYNKSSRVFRNVKCECS